MSAQKVTGKKEDGSMREGEQRVKEGGEREMEREREYSEREIT